MAKGTIFSKSELSFSLKIKNPFSTSHYHSQIQLCKQKSNQNHDLFSHYSLSPTISHNQLLSLICYLLYMRCTPTNPVTFQILINDIITYPSSKPGVVFIKNEDEAKLTSGRKNKIAFIEFLLCIYHLCRPRKYVILFSLYKWGKKV